MSSSVPPRTAADRGPHAGAQMPELGSHPQERPRPRRLTRRHAVAGLTAVTGGVLISLGLRQPAFPPSIAVAARHDAEHAAGSGTPVAVSWETYVPGDLQQPEIRESVNGVLETELRVGFGYQDIGGYRLFLRNYEGMMPGPTLRLRPGDTLKLRLINDLPPNRDVAPLNPDQVHHINSTNFHFHGGHVSPSGIADNVLRFMEPGQSYDVEIELPADHPTGLYWYHPHLHGAADMQIASGMVGAIIIDDDGAVAPEIAAAREQVLVLAEAVFDGLYTVEEFDTLWSEVATRFLMVNGQREPIIRMQPGEVQRWNVLHTGYQSDILMNLAAHQLNVFAYDGVDLPALEALDSVLMAPGQRAEILVQAGEPGTYALAGLPNDQGYPSPSGPLATVVVEGEPVTMALPASLPTPPLDTITDDELTGSREVVFSVRGPENDAAGHWQEFDFMVDGKLFDHDRVDQLVELGAVEEWTITNLHIHDHVFHIHVNPFQVTQVNGEPLAQPVWRDTVVVPGNGSVTFRTRFLDFTGKYVLHCHMMNHEELGMMQIVEVVDNG